MAPRRRIEEVRGAARLSIGADGPVSLPRDSSETLALLLSRLGACSVLHADGLSRTLGPIGPRRSSPAMGSPRTGRGLRRALSPGSVSTFAVYLLGRSPPGIPLESRWQNIQSV